MGPAAVRRPAARGFTYLGVLYLVVVLGLTGAAAATLWSFHDQRLREHELLFIGRQFQQALESYRASTALAGNPAPGAAPPMSRPRSIEELLRDPRVPFVKRHLRRRYLDPITGGAEWGLLRDEQGGVIGVHSLSSRKPIRRAPGDGVAVQGEGSSYRAWIFKPPEEQPAT